MSKLLNQKAKCTDRPSEIGIITYYNSDNGEINLKYGSDTIITHISKCKIVN